MNLGGFAAPGTGPLVWGRFSQLPIYRTRRVTEQVQGGEAAVLTAPLCPTLTIQQQLIPTHKQSRDVLAFVLDRNLPVKSHRGSGVGQVFHLRHSRPDLSVPLVLPARPSSLLLRRMQLSAEGAPESPLRTGLQSNR